MDQPKARRSGSLAEVDSSKGVRRAGTAGGAPPSPPPVTQDSRPHRSGSAGMVLSQSANKLSGLFQGFRRSKKRRCVVGIVDDEERWLKELSAFFAAQNWDAEIVVARDGADALEMLHANAEDMRLCLVDMVMPGMSGLDLVTRARAEPALEHVVFMMTTEWSGKSAKKDLSHFQMQDDRGAAITVLAKPLQSAAVTELLQPHVTGVPRGGGGGGGGGGTSSGSSSSCARSPRESPAGSPALPRHSKDSVGRKSSLVDVTGSAADATGTQSAAALRRRSKTEGMATSISSGMKDWRSRKSAELADNKDKLPGSEPSDAADKGLGRSSPSVRLLVPRGSTSASDADATSGQDSNPTSPSSRSSTSTNARKSPGTGRSSLRGTASLDALATADDATPASPGRRPTKKSPTNRRIGSLRGSASIDGVSAAAEVGVSSSAPSFPGVRMRVVPDEAADAAGPASPRSPNAPSPRSPILSPRDLVRLVSPTNSLRSSKRWAKDAQEDGAGGAGGGGGGGGGGSTVSSPKSSLRSSKRYPKDSQEDAAAAASGGVPSGGGGGSGAVSSPKTSLRSSRRKDGQDDLVNANDAPVVTVNPLAQRAAELDAAKVQSRAEAYESLEALMFQSISSLNRQQQGPANAELIDWDELK